MILLQLDLEKINSSKEGLLGTLILVALICILIVFLRRRHNKFEKKKIEALSVLYKNTSKAWTDSKNLERIAARNSHVAIPIGQIFLTPDNEALVDKILSTRKKVEEFRASHNETEAYKMEKKELELLQDLAQIAGISWKVSFGKRYFIY